MSTSLSDLDIARAATMQPIEEIAQAAGISPEAVELYGKYKCKLDPSSLTLGPRGKIVLVTAISPTPAGEGKSTTTVGLGDSLARAFAADGSGRRAMIALREPSLGPTLGLKGGATGGGYSQVVPMDDINLHFTGDFHAITSANNALCSLIDNHLHQGNSLGLDPRRISFKRVVDMNDRALRHVVVGLDGPTNGVPREDGFDITVASEIMAVLCLCSDLADLKGRLGEMRIGQTFDRRWLTVDDLGVAGALTLLLKDAVKPNLVQTIAGTPALVHGGPFANIAHGCNSVIATSVASRLADVVVTEAGFGADLGAEKYLDIASRAGDIAPDAVVLVATIRALKMHGGVSKTELADENVAALRDGVSNLERHVANIRRFGFDPVVAINIFSSDTAAELDWLHWWCQENEVRAVRADVWANGGGGPGGDALAATVLDSLKTGNTYRPLYPVEANTAEKIETIAGRLYGASSVEFSPLAQRQLEDIDRCGLSGLPVCIAKTQYSFSDDPTALGAPSNFTLHVRELIPKTGAGFIVALTGSVMTMPGLPTEPAALSMDVLSDGTVVGLS